MSQSEPTSETNKVKVVIDTLDTKEESPLNCETKTAIRKYLISLIALPGAMSIFVAFFLGFFIHDVAFSKAQNDAFKLVSEKILDVIADTASARQKIMTVLDEVEALQKTVKTQGGELNKSLSSLSKEVSDSESKLVPVERLIKATETQLQTLMENPEETIKALEGLRNYGTEMKLSAKLQNFSDTKLKVVAAIPIDLVGFARVKKEGEFQLKNSSDPQDFPISFNHTFSDNDRIIGTWWTASNNPTGLENISVNTSHKRSEVTLSATTRGTRNDGTVSIQVFVLIQYQDEAIAVNLPKL